MNEENKFIVRICCEPQFEVVANDEITSFTQKITTMRAKLIDEGIIGQLREIMREQGITELLAIDESKVIQMVKEHEALEIIKNKSIDLLSLRHAFVMDKEGEQSGFEWYNNATLVKRGVYDTLTQEEYDLLKEVLL